MSISVLITCHNEEAYIEQAIRSVVAQTAYQHVLEILVVDDGSTDGSPGLLASLVCECPKLRITRTSGIGLSSARNLAILASRGEHVAILDGDDFWRTDKLETQLPALRSGERVGLVYSDYFDFMRSDLSDAELIAVRRYHPDTKNTLAKYFVNDAPIMPSSVIICRAALDEVGPFDESLKVGEDTELFLRLAESWQFAHVPGGLIYKRRHGRNITQRLDTLLPVSEELTTRFAARNPQLMPLRSKRMARRYGKVGNDCAKKGETSRAVSYLSRALYCDPLFWRTYAYLALAFLPKPLGVWLRLRLWHAASRRL